MSRPSVGLYFIFDSEEKLGERNKSKVFDFILEEYGKNKVREGWDPKEWYTDRTPVRYMSISSVTESHLGAFRTKHLKFDQGLWGLSITSIPGFLTQDNRDEQNYANAKFFALFQRCCNELQPLAGYLNDDMVFQNQEATRTMISKYEYYSDPYFFAFDTPDELPEWDAKPHEFRPCRAFNYLNDANVKKELEEIKKVLHLKALKEIVSKYTFKSFTTPQGGLGCDKYESFTTSVDISYFFPKYYVREEVRRRGLQLKIENAEITYDNYRQRAASRLEKFREDKNLINKWYDYEPYFEFDLEKSLDAYQTIYKKELDTTLKDNIVDNFFVELTFNRSRKDEIDRLFPCFAAFHENKNKNPDYTITQYKHMKDIAFKELRNYLENE